MSVIQLDNNCNSDKRTRSKAYALQLSNGWYCLDDIYFHQVYRNLPMLKPLVAEFRTLASRQRHSIDRQAIEIPLPDEECRRRLLTIMLEGKRLAFPIEAGCADLARQSQDMSGRDLRNWITKAEALGVMRAVGEGGAKEFLLRFRDFEAARGPLAPHTA